MRVAANYWCAAIVGLHLFRRILDGLIMNHIEGSKGFRALWTGTDSSTSSRTRSTSGAAARSTYAAPQVPRRRDKLTHCTEAMYRFLRSRVRMVGLPVPAEYYLPRPNA